MPKIALIGAGSVVFARNMIRDVLSFPELADSTFALMDIDPERLDLIARLGRKMIEQVGTGATLTATLERREALEGADFVICMVQVGGLEAFKQDIEIPLRYGVDQSVGDTLGPGGVFRGMRTIPVLTAMAQEMETLCSRALLINYSNPMAINCWAANAASSTRTVGLCHSVQGTASLLSDYVQAPFEEVSYWVAGINHMAWFLRFEHNGEDLYPRLREVMNNPDAFATNKVRFEIMRCFDYFVTESTHHMSEYVPYFRTTQQRVEDFATPRWDYYQLCKRDLEPTLKQIREQLDSDEPVEMRRSREYGSRIIHAETTGQVQRINGNVPNTGLITNLPAGCCVEVPCYVDQLGLHPCYVGDLPPQLAALNRSNIAVQELAVKAGLEGDRRAVVQAVCLDPLTGALLLPGQIETMVDEMLAAEAQWLPQFA